LSSVKAYKGELLTVVTYEVLNNKDFNKKFKECKVEGSAKECLGFTILPTDSSAGLMDPHKFCSAYIRDTDVAADLNSAIVHESIHVLQYLCGCETVEAAAYLLEAVIQQVIKK
jgi:hypothetical protein